MFGKKNEEKAPESRTKQKVSKGIVQDESIKEPITAFPVSAAILQQTENKRNNCCSRWLTSRIILTEYTTNVYKLQEVTNSTFTSSVLFLNKLYLIEQT